MIEQERVYARTMDTRHFFFLQLSGDKKKTLANTEPFYPTRDSFTPKKKKKNILYFIRGADLRFKR